MDDRSIFLSKSERYLLELVNQICTILGHQRAPETIVSVLAERIFDHYIYQRSIKSLESRGHLVKMVDGYKVAHGLLDNPRLRVNGEAVDQISPEQLRRLCGLYQEQPDRNFSQTDFGSEEDGVAPRRHRTEVANTQDSLPPRERKPKSFFHFRWDKIVWQIAAELCSFAPLMEEQKLTLWLIVEVAHELGHKTIIPGTLIKHLIEKGPLIANHDGTWCLTDIGKHQTRSSDQTQKLSREQRLAILQKMQTPEK